LLAAGLASSRLKPVPLKQRVQSVGLTPTVGPASAGKLLLLIFVRRKSRHRQSRLGCRLNAGFVEWVEPHGCGESAVRAWMPVRRGPTERGRSEGTLTKEGPNREQALLLTFGWCDFRLFKSKSPKAKPSAPQADALLTLGQTKKIRAASGRTARILNQSLNQCTNSAIKIMIGIGMPRNHRSSERMMTLLNQRMLEVVE